PTTPRMRSFYIVALALPLTAALPYSTAWSDGSGVDVQVQNEIEYSFEGGNVDQGAVVTFNNHDEKAAAQAGFDDDDDDDDDDDFFRDDDDDDDDVGIVASWKYSWAHEAPPGNDFKAEVNGHGRITSTQAGKDASAEQNRGQEPVNTPSEEAKNAQSTEAEKPSEEVVDSFQPSPLLSSGSGSSSGSSSSSSSSSSISSSSINTEPTTSTIDKPTLRVSPTPATSSNSSALFQSPKATMTQASLDSPVAVVSSSPVAVISSSPVVVSSSAIENNSPSPTTTTQAISPSVMTTTGSSQDRTYALNLHNNVRPAHEAPKLEWSDELEKKALLWAQQCIFDHPSKDDAFESQFASHSQNIAFRSHNDTDNFLKALYVSFEHWYYKESNWFDYQTQDIRADADWNDGPDVGHFKNIASRNLDELGCATYMCPKLYMDRSRSEYSAVTEAAYTVCDFARKDKRERLPIHEYIAHESRKTIVKPVGRVPPIEEARWDALQTA
ncbi:hypothetical protein L249_8228, partial [Ophiocordyceps polyrhachis-furcata BCC 54312]